MARLTREEAQIQTRERLLASAKEVFAKRGIAGASVEDIAEQAGFSKGAIYSNFESKEALVLELLRSRMTEEIAGLQAILDQSCSAEEILEALKMRYSNLETQVTWCLLSSEFQLQAGRSPEFAEAFAALYRNQRKAVARLVSLVAEKTGRIPVLDTEEIATALMALTHGIALQRAADPKSVQGDTAGKALQLFLAAALSPVQSPAPARKRAGKKES